MTRPTLSVILITKNEAELVGQCLESVKWADEIIVVDSGSTDATVEICKRYTDRVTVTDWPGFGPQKNRALAMATGDWVLSIDADEEVTPALRDSIQLALLQAGNYDAYELSRFSSYCGRFIRHGGWWPDPVLRLFRRDQGKFSDHRVHERVLVDPSRIGRLEGLLITTALEILSKYWPRSITTPQKMLACCTAVVGVQVWVPPFSMVYGLFSAVISCKRVF